MTQHSRVECKIGSANLISAIRFHEEPPYILKCICTLFLIGEKKKKKKKKDKYVSRKELRKQERIEKKKNKLTKSQRIKKLEAEVCDTYG